MTSNLLTNQEIDVTGPWKEIKFKDGSPRLASVYIQGTFDGCTVTVEQSPDGVTPHGFDGTAFTCTAQDDFTVENCAKYLRASVSNDGAGTDITVIVQ